MEIVINSYALVDNPRITIFNTQSGKDVWAIRKDSNMCLTKDGKFEFEPRPSERTDVFFENSRFTLDEAKAMLDNVNVAEMLKKISKD